MAAGRVVLAVAPTMSAVEELQKVGFTDAITVERVLQDPRIRGEIRGKVIILDEAGMVRRARWQTYSGWRKIVRCASSLAETRSRSGAWKPAMPCGYWRRNPALKTVALTQVQRQTRKDYRDAMEELRGTRSADSRSWMRWEPFVRRQSLNEPRPSPTPTIPPRAQAAWLSARLTTRLAE